MSQRMVQRSSQRAYRGPDRGYSDKGLLRYAPVAIVVLLVIAVIFAVRPCTAPASSEDAGNGDDAASVSQEQPLGAGLAESARFNGIVCDGQALSEDDREALLASDARFTDDPQVVYQLPELESGCEIAALVSALQSMGFDVSTTDIADDYLYIDGDYEYGYFASPYTDFGGGFPPGVADAANAYLSDVGSGYRAHDLTGSTFGGLSALVSAGYPVLVWTTLEQTPPNFDAELGAIGDWYVNEHCVAVYGISADGVVASDPLKGLVTLDVNTFASVYQQCGSRALCIW